KSAAGEGGTGEDAQLANYTLLGKTGTAVRFEDGRYVEGEYTASFAALFPADDPQLVVIVKIDNPQGKYYGGLTAAPVTRNMLQQALASRRVAIDRGRLADTNNSRHNETETMAVSPPASKVVVAWPHRNADSTSSGRAVPSVVGQTARAAVLALHQQGFRVGLRGLGRVTRTAPSSGETVQPGTIVTVWAE
ncbi:MAG TPA: penicillin-binding transpeptidase domain-containing protein, partial [Gemmatimonadales bacterium]|nr:penicillin-binding transpeptidase domain-containing protein [Gemmatimonadales bacterium]